MLDLLEVESLLLVELALLALLQSLCLFLLLKSCVHPLSDLGGTSLSLLARLERLLFGLEFDALSLLEGQSEALASCLLPSSILSFRLLHSSQLRL